MQPSLASTSDAAALGYDVTSTQLAQASARVRLHSGQQITPGSTTITMAGPSALLPQQPIRSVDAVMLGGGHLTSSMWELRPGGILLVHHPGDLFTVTWSHGWDEVPEAIVAMTCAIAARIATQNPGLLQGAQHQTSGIFSQTFGMDAARGVAGLTAGERRQLDRIFPRIPQPIRIG